MKQLLIIYLCLTKAHLRVKQIYLAAFFKTLKTEKGTLKEKPVAGITSFQIFLFFNSNPFQAFFPGSVHPCLPFRYFVGLRSYFHFRRRII